MRSGIQLTRMDMKMLTVLAGLLVVAGTCRAEVVVGVPGIANPWLAGMPDGTDDGWGDIAPVYSPVLVSDLNLGTGVLHIQGVAGAVNNVPWAPGFPADGNPDDVQSHLTSNYGKSNITCPINALLGVFLTEATPVGPGPAALDFSTVASRDYLELAPLLSQVFFIGDGRTSQGQQQTIHVPAGAARFYLGVMDSWQHSSNWGSFEVTVPEPATLSLLAIGLGALAIRRRKRA